MLEKMFHLWENDFHYEIGADNDGLDMIEIRYYDDNKLGTSSSSRVSFTKDQAKLIAQALIELTGEK